MCEWERRGERGRDRRRAVAELSSWHSGQWAQPRLVCLSLASAAALS
jgi:hypothetical protein